MNIRFYLLALCSSILLLTSVVAQERSAAWFGVASYPNINNKGGVKPGAVLGFVWEKSPAEKAGLQEGDLIVSVSNKPVRNPNQLARLVGQRVSGEEVQIQYQRSKKIHTVKVKLGSINEAKIAGALKVETMDLSVGESKQIWAIVEKDTKLLLRDMGYSPDVIAKVIEAMKPAGEELQKLTQEGQGKKGATKNSHVKIIEIKE